MADGHHLRPSQRPDRAADEHRSRAWLNPASGRSCWVDLAAPSIPETLILSDTFAFHPLSVEDAMAKLQYPKVEAYDGYLYVILHGIDFQAAEHGFGTHDVDFFVGPNYLVTVHDGHSRSINDLRDHATRNAKILGEGPVALFHRIVDAMVDHYRPEIEKLEDRLDELEKADLRQPGSGAGSGRFSTKSARSRPPPDHDAAARRDRAAGAPRLRRHQHRDVVPLPRRLRSPRPDRRRRDDLPGSDHRDARRAPVQRQQPAERGDEGADGRLDHLHAARRCSPASRG